MMDRQFEFENIYLVAVVIWTTQHNAIVQHLCVCVCVSLRVCEEYYINSFIEYRIKIILVIIIFCLQNF